MSLVGLLIYILIVGLICALIIWIIDQIPAVAPFRTIARAIVGLIAIILLLSALLGGISVPVLRIS